MHPGRYSRAVAAVAALAFAGLAASVAGAGERLSLTDVHADLALLEASLGHLHPGYSRYAAVDELSAAFRSLAYQAAEQGGMTQAELYTGVSRVLALIRCNHTKAELPAALADQRASTPTYLPFRWELVGARLRGIVTDPVAGIDIEAGDEIIAIDGVPLAHLIDTFRAYVPVDGYNDHAASEEMAFSSEFAGGAIEHFGALLNTPAPLATLTLAGPDGRSRTVAVPRLTGDEWRAHLASGGGFYRNFRDAVELRFVEPDVALLTVDTFVNYRRPVAPAQLFDPLFRAISARGINTLIVDLRNNGGGSDDAQLALFERLTTTRARMFRDVTAVARDFGPAEGHVSSWDARAMAMAPADYTALPDGRYRIAPDWVGPALAYLDPHPLAFAGDLIVLIDASVSSGSNHLVSRLAERPRLTLVGSPGGGSAAGVTAGVLYTLTLPASGVRVRIPAWQQWIDRDVADDGRGVVPDIPVSTTVTDWRAGRDPALREAVAIARGSD